MTTGSFKIGARCYRREHQLWTAGFLLMLAAGACGAAEIRSGEDVYNETCGSCHATGVLQAPKLGDNADWSKREQQGLEVLLEHAIKGYKNMPAKGGNPTIKDQEIENAIIHMLSSSGVESNAETPAPGQTVATSAAAEIRSGEDVYNETCGSCHATGVLQAPKLGDNADWSKREQQGLEVLLEHAIEGYKNMPAKGGNPTIKDEEIENAIIHMLVSSGSDSYAAKPAPGQTVATSAAAASVADRKTAPQTRSSNVNSFNRLMKSKVERNQPPPKDGIHDPMNEGTHMLQPPRAAFEVLSPAKSGNQVDWVKALEKNEIAPRYDRLDPEVKPVVMDLNIVREVKGSMPDVVYPHKQHTEWLDCSNCHPAIFIPQKGANQISMASILLGQKCGVCHGKVAFPISECRRCHSQQKPAMAETSNKQAH